MDVILSTIDLPSVIVPLVSLEIPTPVAERRGPPESLRRAVDSLKLGDASSVRCVRPVVDYPPDYCVRLANSSPKENFQVPSTLVRGNTIGCSIVCPINVTFSVTLAVADDPSTLISSMLTTSMLS